MAEPVLVITGATATGKSAVAVALAQRIDGEIVSMDSRQVYRGLDIGTAKPTVEERSAIRHHGIDLVDPDRRYSAGRFGNDARAWIADIRQRGRVPIVVGGTGFFLRALIEPLFAEPPLDPARRERLQRWLATRPRAELQRWVTVLDPVGISAGYDPQRSARRIEVALLTGRTLGWWQRHAPAGAEPVPARVFVLELPRAELYRRINERVDRMIEQGLVAEVRELLAHGYDLCDPGMKAVGYIELVPYLRGEGTLAEAVLLIKNATRRYARRQLTWFRRQLPAGHTSLDATVAVTDLADRVSAAWGRDEP